MQEGTIVEWTAAEGSAIAKGDEIAEIETEKVNNGYEAPCSGLLRRHVAPTGQTVPVGGLIAVVAPTEVTDAEIDAFIATFESAFVPEPPEDEASAPQTVEIDGRVINYLDTGGDGTPMLLVHGICADLDSWMFNISPIADARRVIAIDLPGHGASSKDVGDGSTAFFVRCLEDFLSTLGIDRAHLAGHSLGGTIAIGFALAHPARTASLGLIAPAGLGPEINGAFLTQLIGADKRRGARLALSQLVADEGLISRDMIETFLRYKRTDGVPDALATIAAASFDGDRQLNVFADRMGEIVTPVLCIWGEQDEVVPPAHASSLPDHAKVHLLANTGHLPHMEMAPQVSALLATLATESD
tara:strand:+ start:4955 stop:6025 length:1071 start_codon:yes stop_codon:yes gene_type:complete